PATFLRRVTAEGNLKAVKATPVTAPMDAPGAMKIGWIADDGTLVKSGDVVVRFDPTDFQQLLLTGNEDRSTATNSLSKTNAQAQTTRVNLQRDASQAQRELESAKRFKFDDAEVFSRYQRVEAEVDQHLAGDKKEYAQNVLHVRDQLARTERDLLGIEDKKAGLKIKQAEQGLHALEIRAPHDGLLVLQRDWRGEGPRVGGTAWPGMPLGEIPDLQTMKAEVFVLEADAAGLAMGQKATVTLDSAPGVSYPAKVTQIDKLARPRMRGVPVQYFGVTLTLDRTDIKTMKPGSRVLALIELENRPNAFAIPRQAIFDKDGKKIVYRRHGSAFDAVPVTIASSSAGRVVVTKGIAKGDELALLDPASRAEKPNG
ncbi:MAG: efflux RND transporter periplasmic adaptor subunit, partial [Thermoanaerobaculia bacterium]